MGWLKTTCSANWNIFWVLNWKNNRKKLIHVLSFLNVELYIVITISLNLFSVNREQLDTAQLELNNDKDRVTQDPLNDEENFDILLKNIAKDSSPIGSGGTETDNNLIVKIDVNDAISINNDVNLQKLDYYEKPNNLIQTTNNAVNIKLKCNIFNGMFVKFVKYKFN